MLAPLCALLALTCARAEIFRNDEAATSGSLHGPRSIDTTAKGEADLRGCMYAGRWFADGAVVRVSDACLRCACARGALQCARATCAAAPDPPPPRCALLHRRTACCPELHCPDGVRSLEEETSAPPEEETGEATTPGHACAEDGGVFAAGSALGARAACEQCWCLRGARRCVRPRCLPPPRDCAPRPAPGVCCPQRYYCHAGNLTAADTVAEPPHGRHDCLIEGEWVSEGERVQSARAGDCAQCFCLRGAVRCQPQQCAPALRGCEPLLRPGQCCPHRYRCAHPDRESVAGAITVISSNALTSRSDERSFRTAAPLQPATAAETPSALSSSSAYPTPAATTKVKRKTDDTSPTTISHKTTQNTAKAAILTSNVTQETTTAVTAKSVSTTEVSTAGPTSEPAATEQPEGSVRVIINGTINCTAELSSTLSNETAANDTHRASADSEAGADAAAEEPVTPEPPEIITERAGDSFTVNVSSSLRANSSLAAPPPAAPLSHSLNISKKNKEDYDYDYAEPTLPPSLPNLKIIPFVAADAVVDEEIPSKDESLAYPAMEREDKFPVYYANVEHNETPLSTRREVLYQPTQYPIFEGALPAAAPLPSPAAPPATPARPPAGSKFSPPVETEGGFIPKGPGIIDEYYAVYPSTPAPVPHLTTSMQIEPATPDPDECVMGSGRRVRDGETVWLSCARCACARGRLVCRARAAPAAAPLTGDVTCCGDHVCGHDNSTAIPVSTQSTHKTEMTSEVTRVPIRVESHLIPFDPPADRSEPEPALAAASPPPPRATSTPAAPPAGASLSNGTTESHPQEATSSIAPTTVNFNETNVNVSMTTSTPAPQRYNTNDSDVQSQEYEDEDDEEEFSFGSVLKLLLSESYDTTTAATHRKTPTTPLGMATTVTTDPPVTQTSTEQPPPSSTAASFVPIPHRPYLPPKRVFSQSTVNRIDHLVLGEATAIRKTTASPRPTSPPPPPVKKLTTRPALATPPTRAEPAPAPAPVPAAGGGAGLLKLAGCNIYGRMYRVGRIIAELSSPCQECRCTELGVQCAPLRC